jgi:hypothetical protein
MTSPQPDTTTVDTAIERRASFRVPSVEQRVARLRIAHQEILVEVLDESAEGFAILLGGTLQCHVGQKALLQTLAGWAEVVIMNAYSSEASVASDDSESRQVPCTRLGLGRVRDLPIKRRGSWLIAIGQTMQQPLVPLYSTWSGAVLTVFMVICSGWFVVYGLEYPRGIITLVRRDLPAPAPMSPPDTRLPDMAWLEFPWSLPLPSFGGSSSRGEQSFSELVDLTRPEFLLHPETVGKLGLSQAQLHGLRAHADRHVNAADYQGWDIKAAQTAIGLLTLEQRDMLRRLGAQ